MRKLFACFMAPLLMIGCSSAPSPEAAFEAFNKAIEEGNVTKAASMIKPTLTGFRAEIASSTWIRMANVAKQNGGIDRIASQCDTVGEIATCTSAITFKNGVTNKVPYSAIKLDGTWYVSSRG